MKHAFYIVVDLLGGAQVERGRWEERDRARGLCVAAPVDATQSAHSSQLAESMGLV